MPLSAYNGKREEDGKGFPTWMDVRAADAAGRRKGREEKKKKNQKRQRCALLDVANAEKAA